MIDTRLAALELARDTGQDVSPDAVQKYTQELLLPKLRKLMHKTIDEVLASKFWRSAGEDPLIQDAR